MQQRVPLVTLSSRATSTLLYNHVLLVVKGQSCLLTTSGKSAVTSCQLCNMPPMIAPNNSCAGGGGGLPLLCLLLPLRPQESQRPRQPLCPCPLRVCRPRGNFILQPPCLLQPLVIAVDTLSYAGSSDRTVTQRRTCFVAALGSMALMHRQPGNLVT
jgi:hypothetical protein